MKIGITCATGQFDQHVINNLNNKVSADNIVALVRSPQKAFKIKKVVAFFALLLAFSAQKIFAQTNKCEVAENNKKIVVEFYQKLFGDKDISVIDQYIVEDYIQHNPAAADGRQAIKDIAVKWLANKPKSKVDFQKVAADGDLVFLHIKAKSFSGKDASLIDIFRLEDGKIVEHWDIMQEVPEKSANPHPMF